MNKFKQLFIGIIIGAFIVSVTPVTAAVQQFILTKSDYKLFVDGKEYADKTYPLLTYKGKVYAPLGKVISLIGSTYSVDDKAKKINLPRPTLMPTSKPAATPSFSPTPTPIPAPSFTPIPSFTPTPTPTAIPTPSLAPTPTPTINQNNGEVKEITVYITKTGAKYHRSGCRYLSKSKISISLENAKEQGYSPCSVCNPPR